MEKNKEEILREVNTDIETLLSIQEDSLATLREKVRDIKLQKLREKIFSKEEQNDTKS